MLTRELLMIALACGLALTTSGHCQQHRPITLETEYVTYAIGADGRNLSFIDKQAGKDYCKVEPAQPFIALKKGGKTFTPSACSFADGKITVEFKQPSLTVVVKVSAKQRYLVFELASVSDPEVDEIVMSALGLTINENIGHIVNVVRNDEFAACVLALNLQTNARWSRSLWSACYRRFGLVGAKVALIGCPADQIRSVIKEVVLAEGLPYSPLGGAWALDAEETRGSYLFADPSEADIDEWIGLAKDGGITHVHLCGWWSSLGHYEPQPKRFPNGVEGMKAVVAKIHAAGLKAGMHTLTGCISKGDPWVHPVPDKRLAKDATFTLAGPVSAEATTVLTTESPKGLPTQSGYWVRGGNDIQIGDEIISYKGISDEPPYGFTDCTRGARGTKAAAHEKGAAVGHLAERYGHYLPDGESSLVDEIGERIADIFNTCEFDMIYFDGAEAMGGVGPSWHYVGKMKLAIFSRIKRPCLVEASSWAPQHTWHIHSRLGAWDNACRGTKRFLDKHIQGIPGYQTNLLPVQLGWWALHGPGASHDATQPDEIEYLCGKCLGHDCAFSMQGLSPGSLRANPGWQRSLEIMGQYEALRLSNYFSDSIKEALRVPRKEFRLIKSPAGDWQLAPVEYLKHKVTGMDDGSSTWSVTNDFDAQHPEIRIQALRSVSPYDAPENLLVTDFSDASKFSGAPESEKALITRLGAAKKGVSHRIETSSDQVKVGAASGLYTATNSASTGVGWCRMTTEFSPPISLEGQTALGMWVYGDGKGEVLNFQIGGVSRECTGDHYVVVDFEGWRYFALVEPEGERVYDYPWPYWHMHVTRGAIPYGSITRLTLFYNNIPPKGTVACYLSPIKALQTAMVALENPTLTLAGQEIAFPTMLKSGCYLEFKPPSDCKLYDARGALIKEVTPEGEAPTLNAGDNEVSLTCLAPMDYPARARVTIGARGKALEQ